MTNDEISIFENNTRQLYLLKEVFEECLSDLLDDFMKAAQAAGDNCAPEALAVLDEITQTLTQQKTFCGCLYKRSRGS